MTLSVTTLEIIPSSFRKPIRGTRWGSQLPVIRDTLTTRRIFQGGQPLHSSKGFGTPSKASFLPYALLLTMGISWGLAVSTGKLAGLAGGHPLGIALWQVCVAGLLLGSIVAVRFPVRKPRGSVVVFSLFCGAFGVSFPAYALFASSLHLPAGVVAMAFASMPLFTYILSALFRVEPLTRVRVLGVTIGLGAMVLIIGPEQALPDKNQAPWVFLCMAASVSMSIENVYAGGMRPEAISSLQLSLGRQLGAIAWLTPIVFISDTAIPVFEAWGTLQWSAMATGIISGTAFTILLIVIRTSGPVFASQTAYIITLAGVGWGMVIFDETHSGYVWAALLMTLLGAILVRPRQPQPSETVVHSSG